MENEIKFTLSRKLSKNQKWYYGGSFKLPDGNGYFVNVFESQTKDGEEKYLTVYLRPMNISNEWNRLSKNAKIKAEETKDVSPFDYDLNDLFLEVIEDED